MNALKKWREAQDLSIPAAAARARVGRATWWRWESGDRPIGIDKLSGIAGLTGIPASELRPDLAKKLLGVAA